VTDIVIDISTDPKPTTVAELRRRYPNVSFRDNPPSVILDRLDAARLYVDPAPATTRLQVAELQPPEVVDGRWVQRWVVRDLTQPEIDAEIEAELDAAIETSPINRAMFRAQARFFNALHKDQLPANWTEGQITQRYRQVIRDALVEILTGS
jgi:hypothetical protein